MKELFQVLKQLTDCVTDLFFAYPMLKAVERRAPKPTNQIYLYKFHYRGTFSFTSQATGNQKNYGVAHGDDAQYLFYESPQFFGAKNETMNKNDFQMVKDMVGFWTSFATTGYVLLLTVLLVMAFNILKGERDEARYNRIVVWQLVIWAKGNDNNIISPIYLLYVN